MYVCLCKGITDSQIRQAVAAGESSYSSLRKSLGLASQCGRCSVAAREIFRESLPAHPHHHENALFYPASMAFA